MGVLSKEWRARAIELDKALQHLFNTDPQVHGNTVRAVKCAVLPELLNVLADLLEVTENQTLDGTLGRLHAIAKRNNDIRLAAARGDWDAIDRIASGQPDAEPAGPAST